MKILLLILLALLVTCHGGDAMVGLAQMDPVSLSSLAVSALLLLLPMFLLFVLACLRLITWRNFWLLCLGWWLFVQLVNLAFCAYDPEGWQAEFEQALK